MIFKKNKKNEYWQYYEPMSLSKKCMQSYVAYYQFVILDVQENNIMYTVLLSIKV